MSDHPEPQYDQIIAALTHILDTDKFKAAPQMSAFLRYVVEQTASGNEKRIKAFTVAVDALGKPENFDPQNDPVVRVLAGRLRACLTAYYEKNPSTDIIISMTTGTYVPEFSYREPGRREALQRSPESENVVSLTTDQFQPEHAVQIPASAGDDLEQREQARQTPTVARDDFESTQPEKPSTQQASLVKMAIAASLVAVAVIIAYSAGGGKLKLEPAMLAGTPSTQLKAQSPADRDRPEKLSVFVSALEPDNTLESQLNTMISGVFSESDALRVYRILHQNQAIIHWPEDYLVSLNVVPLSDSTQVSVQLIDAQTGRIGFSDTLSLLPTATKVLMREDLTKVIEFARQLIDQDGPLMKDYASKTMTENN